MTIQLREPISVKTPLGDGMAILIETNAMDQFWTIVLNRKNGCPVVTFPQNKILVKRNYTIGYGIDDNEMSNIIGMQSE